MVTHIKQILRRSASVLATAVLLLQVTMPLTAFADGNGSTTACKDTTPGVIGSQTGTQDSVTVNVGSGKIATGACIKSGSNMFGGNQHSGVLGNGVYENGCYKVEGVGTQTVKVTRLKSTNACQGISHIDVVTAPNTACYEQVPYWKVGKVFAEDVYTRSWVKEYSTEYRYKKYEWVWKYYISNNDRKESNVGKSQYGEWDYYSTTGWGEERSGDIFKIGNEWYKYVFYESKQTETGGHYDYTKVKSVGDPHPSLYGPYEVANDPYTVPFNVGSGNHVIGDTFTYNETNYQDDDGKIEYKYVQVGEKYFKNGKRIPCDKPADLVEYDEWVEGQPNCDTKKVKLTRTKTVTPFVLAQDGYTWIPGAPVVTVETDYRNLTSEELKDCTPKPDDKIEYGKWMDEDWSCGDRVINQTRTVTTTSYTWDGDSWELDASTTKVTEEERTRELTWWEKDKCEGSISGYKFNDSNFDGHWGWGEHGIWGWKINLYEKKSCEIVSYDIAGLSVQNETNLNFCDGWQKVDSTWTDFWGHYEFDDLEPGEYKVCEEQRFGWSQTFPESGCYWITIHEGKHNDVYFRNFGNTKNGKLIINKVVENSGETEETFDFNVKGWGVDKNFDDLGDGDSDSTYLDSGWYYVSELLGEGTDWTLDSISCGEAWVIEKDNGVKVYVAPGKTVECTFVNKLKSVEVVANPVCTNGFPMLQFSVKATNFDPSQIKLTWLKSDGTSAGADADHVVEYTGTDLSDIDEGAGVYTDTINWPGSNPLLPDWPGYSFVNGQWVQDSADLGGNLRPSAKVKFEVNPETTVDVEYPNDVNGCSPTNGEVLGTDTLTNTGTPALVAIIAALSLVTLAGYVTLGHKRS